MFAVQKPIHASTEIESLSNGKYLNMASKT